MKISKSDLKKLIENVVKEQSYRRMSPSAYRKARSRHPMDPAHFSLGPEELLPNQSEIEDKLVGDIIELIGETMAEMNIPMQMGPSRDPKFIQALTSLISTWLNENIDFNQIDDDRLDKLENDF